jgi:menaquinone-9 beta-reductase
MKLASYCFRATLSSIFEEALGKFPRLSSSLRNGELGSVRRGAMTATCRLERVYRGSVVLAGDASGSVDAITGEDLGLSFRQALAVADALEAGELQEYQTAHNRLARRPRAMARLLLLLDHFAPLRKRVLHGLASDPGLFRRMLTAHLGETSPAFLAEVTATKAP